MRKFIPILLGFIVVTLGVLVSLPGLSGYFFFDDTINIIENPHLRIDSLSLDSLMQAAFSGSAGPLGRPLSTLSFALNYYFTGGLAIAPFEHVGRALRRAKNDQSVSPVCLAWDDVLCAWQGSA